MARTWTPISTVVAILLALVAANSQPGVPSGAALLRKVLGAEGRVPFRGKQTVVLQGLGGSTTTVTDEVHDNGRRSSLLYLVPEPSAGLLVVNDGKWVWEYNPNRRIAVKSPARRDDANHAPEHVAAHILCSYRAETDEEPAVYEGRPAWVLRITPVRADRPRHVWWVDRATALVLKRETYTARGSRQAVSSYSDLVFPARPDLIRFLDPPGCRVVNRASARIATTAREATTLLPRWARPPAASLGGGFELESAQVVSVRGKPSLHLEYSDGLATVSLFQFPGSVPLPSEGRQARRITLGRATASVLHMAPFSIVSWEGRGITYNLVADLSEHTLLSIARAAQ